MVNDVIRMQQEAEQRVQQMRERSRLLVSGGLPEGGRTAETMAAGRPRPRTFPIHTQPALRPNRPPGNRKAVWRRRKRPGDWAACFRIRSSCSC